MNRQQLIDTIRQRKSFLCVGLDTDIQKIPAFLLQTEDPVFEFNRRIIDATRDYCVAYKLNTAFYESLGADGWRIMHKTFHYIGKSHFIIADAKRCDIGNTCEKYAHAFFQQMQCDAITLAPYMGRDSVDPFLKYPDKFSIMLALTSNPTAADFQYLSLNNNCMLFQHIIQTTASWGSPENMMFVVGATRAEWLQDIRKIVPDHFLLVPGVGAQGGSLHQVVKYGINQDVGLLVNSSRAIIYASADQNFDLRAAQEARKLQQEMMQWL